MDFTYRTTRECMVCGKSFWGLEDLCSPCEAIVRSWVAKGFLELCQYLEKVTAFEAYCLSKESSDDPAPAEEPSEVPIGTSPPAVPNSEVEPGTH